MSQLKTYREDEPQEIPNRSGRFYQKDGDWYLQTREGIELGPFESHAEASVCLDDYLEFIGSADRTDLEQFFKIYAAA